MVPGIRLETIIGASITECFELSLSVDAHTASMGPSSERAIAGVTSGRMSLGDTVTWQARHFGIPFRMTSAITAYDAPNSFVDEQTSGPFHHWRHEHIFITTAPGWTLMIDIVDFRSPLGPLGVIADRLVLDRHMSHLLRQRNSWLRSALERPT